MSLIDTMKKATNSDIELLDYELQMRRFQSGESHLIHSPGKVTAVIIEQEGIAVHRAYLTWGIWAPVRSDRMGFTVIGRDVIRSRSKPGIIQGTKEMLLDYIEGNDREIVETKVGTRYHVY